MWPLPSATRSGAFVDVAFLERQALGMVLTLNAYAMLSMQDATVKWLVDAVPVWQVLCVRSAVLVVGCLVLGVVHCYGAPLTPTRGLIARRGAVTLMAWVCYFNAARFRLRQLVTLYFAAPVIVTLLATPLLGEQLGWIRWAAVGLAFIGTVLAANPAGPACAVISSRNT